MAKEAPPPPPPPPPQSSSTSKSPPQPHPHPKPKKLPRLPPTHKIQKRPLLHPALANPRTSAHTPKVIYVSAKSPFISTVKRVRKLIEGVEGREAGASRRELRGLMRGDERGFLEGVGKGREKGEGKGDGDGEEVVLKATGKAVERLLGVAAWFMGGVGGGGEEYVVRVRTGSVGAVDDVVLVEGGGEEGSRVRRVSCLEVGVRLKG